jgi:Sigma-70 factor, region 1.1
MHELLDTQAVRHLLELAEERGYLEPAEVEALALELDLGDEDLAQVTHELEALGIEIGAPVEEPEERELVADPVHSAGDSL